MGPLLLVFGWYRYQARVAMPNGLVRLLIFGGGLFVAFVLLVFLHGIRSPEAENGYSEHVQQRVADPRDEPHRTDVNQATPVPLAVAGADGQPRDGDTAWSALVLLSIDQDFETLVERARWDWRFADAASGAISLCGILSDPVRQAGRFDDPRWRPYRDACSRFPWERLLSEGDLGSWQQPDSPGWELINLGWELPEGDPYHVELSADLLRSSSDFHVLVQASLLYFDRQRMFAPGRERPRALLAADLSGFRTDLALLIACQHAPQACAWDSPMVLGDCAATPSCFPGTSLEEVIAQRRSPQEMELMHELAAQVRRMRGSP